MVNNAKGKIIKGVGGLYTVRLISGGDLPSGSLVKCRARGAFRHEGITPLAGDTVTLSEGKDASELAIESIEERKNSLIRPPMANLDYLFITMAAASPTPILTTVDKLIAIAEFNGIEPVVVITKRELDSEYADKLLSIYSRCGFTCFSLSAKDNVGIEPIDLFIKENMNGKTAAFAGASGIGKSTLMNRLFPSLSLSTSEISRKIERGKHTTREVELFPLSESLDCGYIADTPGFSMLDFERFNFFDKEDLPSTFREFEPYIGECRYTKCSHTKEDECAILAAVKNGDIPKTRHESYVELFETLKAKKKWN
ncbi:MAG: ribosome small subunit-dependent GTPase A [Clostridia bacterium]|nr:ribosome small subunit-dependent GTPase A [Clostridia bacterium]